MNPVIEELSGLVEDIVEEFADNYDLDPSDNGCHVPNEHERMLIVDALYCLIANPEFIAAFNAWQDEVRAEELRRGRPSEAPAP